MMIYGSVRLIQQLLKIWNSEPNQNIQNIIILLKQDKELLPKETFKIKRSIKIKRDKKNLKKNYKDSKIKLINKMI